MIGFTSKSALMSLAIVSLFCIPAFGQVTETEIQKLIPIDLERTDQFGVSVALDGDTALIGAATHDDGGTLNNGAVYVFTRSGGVWTERATLLASDKDNFDYFGSSVALDGDTAVIGARLKNDNGAIDVGAAYVFTRSGGVWTEQAKLLASDKAIRDGFGYSVALDGDTAVIGANNKYDNGAIYVGAAYVFTRSGGVWTEQAKLMASDGNVVYKFGESVALDGATAVIGAPGAVDGTVRVGAAYVFTRSDGVWTEQAKLMASDRDEFGMERTAWFGESVALDGDTAVIGAPDAADNGARPGGAYVFTRSGSVWTEQAKLLASDKEDDDGLGVSVALDGDTAVIGAANDDDSGTYLNGAAYVFTRSGGVWTERAKLMASDREDFDRFGSSVALDATTTIIGATGDALYNDGGAAYVFAPVGITSAAIDVKPRSRKNSISLRAKKGTIPVAILATNTFDALQVDWETVRFGPSGATERHERLHIKDTDGDGDMDAILHFRVRDTGISCGDTEATLTGETFAGQAFTGSDTIKVVKCPKKKRR